MNAVTCHGDGGREWCLKKSHVRVFGVCPLFFLCIFLTYCLKNQSERQSLHSVWINSSYKSEKDGSICTTKDRASHRGDQGGPLVPLGENKNNKGGPGGTSLPLSVPRLPIRNFPHFF